MAILIRSATEQDADTLTSLNADVQAVHAAALPWHFKPPGPDTFPRTAVADVLAQPDNVVFIAEIDGNAAGYAYASPYRARSAYYVTGAGLWPTSGSWNPTMTMVALAQDLADQLAGAKVRSP